MAFWYVPVFSIVIDSRASGNALRRAAGQAGAATLKPTPG